MSAPNSHGNDESMESADWSAKKFIEVGLRVAEGTALPNYQTIGLSLRQAREALAALSDRDAPQHAPWMPTPEQPMFNEDALRDEIAKVWGAHGAHSEVYRMLCAKAFAPVSVPCVELLKHYDAVAAGPHFNFVAVSKENWRTISAALWSAVPAVGAIKQQGD